ncbi:MAG TPA: ABC transporter ATP-binding protein [Nitrospirae bacterium]|nr:ABC transporter ATP-binding protein [Nitrospirota bacterium]
MSQKTILSINNLCKSYKRGSEIIPVLESLNLHINEGEFLALMGPSGSGKSTLLNMIAGIDKPDSGEIIIDNVNITTLDDVGLAHWRALNIGFIFQFYNLIPVLTAFENVELPLLLSPLTKQQRRIHVRSALEVVKLQDRADHYPHQLSGGQQQRVAIARAIVTDPALIVADEPTGDLDKKSAEDILKLMSALNDDFKKTIIMVTHDPRAAKKAKITKYLDKGFLNDVLTETPL